MTGWKDKKPARILIPIAVGIILVVALVLLYNALREYRYKDLVERLQGYSKEIILSALVLTVINYTVLSLYDLLALKYVNRKFPYPKTLFISFLSYVFSYNVGLSVFGSSAIRLRFYSTWGMDGGTIAKIITFCISTFWIGLAAIGGMALLTGPAVQTAFPAFNASTRVLGFLLTAIAAAYLIACMTGRASVSIRGFKISLPSGKLAVGQMLVAALDWFFSAYTLYVLMPAGRPPFPRFLSIFMIAQLAAFSSHVPGGVGILETILVLSLSSYIPSGEVFGSILVYRGVFYLFPLFVAIIAFATRELWAGWKKAAGLAKAGASLMPALLAAAVFVAGAVLLFSAATPSVSQRLKLFGSLFPLFLLETAHFAASITGLALLLIADGLRRRIDAAYYMAVGLLTAGMVFSLLKAFEWEGALILFAVLLLLIPSRNLFYKRAVLFTKPDAWWMIAVGTVLATSAWIGLFAFKHVQYSSDLWWKFDLARNAPRFLRAGLGVAIFAAAVALRILLGHKPQTPKEPFAEETQGNEDTSSEIKGKN